MALFRCARYYKEKVMINNHRILLQSLRGKSQNVEKDADQQPIQFINSKAAEWKAVNSRSGRPIAENSVPWYQPIVVTFSVAVFLLYFCVLREENDIDIELGKSLYDRIEGLEEAQLRMSLKYNSEHGLDTKAIEARLEEIVKEKQTNL